MRGDIIFSFCCEKDLPLTATRGERIDAECALKGELANYVINNARVIYHKDIDNDRIQAMIKVSSGLNKQYVSETLYNIYSMVVSLLRTESVVSLRFYMEELWKEMFGDVGYPDWMHWKWYERSKDNPTTNL